jgi:hypothetical protein
LGAVVDNRLQLTAQLGRDFRRRGLAELVLGIDASLDALRQVDFLGGIEQGGAADFVQVVADRIGRNARFVGVKVGFGGVGQLRFELGLLSFEIGQSSFGIRGVGNSGLGDLKPGGSGGAGAGDGGLLRRTASPVTTLDVWRCSFGSSDCLLTNTPTEKDAY